MVYHTEEKTLNKTADVGSIPAAPAKLKQI